VLSDITFKLTDCRPFD